MPREIELPVVRDARPGALGFSQVGAHVPFPIRRVFYLFGLPAGSARGGHAHRHDQQLMICLRGRLRIRTEAASGRQEYILSGPDRGLYLPPLTWLDFTIEEADSIVLVLAADDYDEADYIRDPAEFRAQLSGGGTEPGAPETAP